ncbi:HAMP domain-containing sensor histidine kinase [Jannaschia sp. M317]|uniref:sensor histidine kinase n=1 Tax=Jannaschia sp. M317 TaxID=2867011 RepID=UPI0021A48C82|nr:HAMP domain-containing sensor histidine kinase [Jannaschia sp. M317]UWQ16961.1 HAMP domain-containing histidine kinase [Jannaschia sp. M317]
MSLNRLRALTRLSAFRLTLSLLCVFAAITALAWAGTYWLVRGEMNRMTDARLSAQAGLVSEALRTGAPLPVAGFGQSVAILSEGARDVPRDLLSRPDGTYVLDERGPERRYLLRSLPDGDRIVVSEVVARQDELLETLTGGLKVTLIGMLVVGLLAGVWLARRGQRRLDLIRAGLAQVAQGRLDTRIDLPGPQDDLSQLADRINATTDRLAQVMAQMRVQTSNIAHDLRTPLARLRAGLETGLIDLTERDQPVDAQMLGTALEQIDRIVGTFNALLRLARIESGAGRAAFDTVDLGALLDQISETFAPVVEDAGQHLRIESADPACIRGDRDLLVQLVANLIQNALRHGTDGQEIALRVRGAEVSVTDQGPGIPQADRARVLLPLFQLESARQGDGFGLGLSMVAAISALHDAELSLSDGPDGRGLQASIRFANLAEL